MVYTLSVTLGGACETAALSRHRGPVMLADSLERTLPLQE